MGVPMMIRILKACAGPVTERKPAVSASNDINSHLDGDREGAGQIPDDKGPKDRRLSQFFIPAKNEI